MQDLIHQIIPCDRCTFCCQGDAIYLHPEWGGNSSDFDTVEYRGRVILKHKENGDCIYLDRNIGCTIWGKHPKICQGLDCRNWSSVPKKQRPELIEKGLITKQHFVIAKKMKKKMQFLKGKNNE